MLNFYKYQYVKIAVKKLSGFAPQSGKYLVATIATGAVISWVIL